MKPRLIYIFGDSSSHAKPKACVVFCMNVEAFSPVFCKMGRTAAQALMEEGRELGFLQARQEALLDFIHSKFGSVPQPIEQQIQAIRDINSLRELTRRVPKANSLDELNISSSHI